MYSKILDKAKEHYRKNIPFVLYALPNNSTLKGVFQLPAASTTDPNINGNKFVFAPFLARDKKLEISFKHSLILETDLPQFVIPENKILFEETKNEQQQHETLVSKAIENIDNGLSKKIVVSRVKTFQLKKLDLPTLAERLFTYYPTAFRYMWFHPESGLWCGASPETLLEVANKRFSTMALAGTKALIPNKAIEWTSKERKEQQWVTDAIVHKLKTEEISFDRSDVYTHKAGSVAHLRTDISGNFKSSNFNAESLADTLHPTPAVCGTPTSTALNFIGTNEGYDRSYYTGYLGPIQKNGAEVNLFVNLRCMKLDDTNAHVFVGGGILSDSIPIDEWKETHNKLQTMVKVLQPLL